MKTYPNKPLVDSFRFCGSSMVNQVDYAITQLDDKKFTEDFISYFFGNILILQTRYEELEKKITEKYGSDFIDVTLAEHVNRTIEEERKKRYV